MAQSVDKDGLRAKFPLIDDSDLDSLIKTFGELETNDAGAIEGGDFLKLVKKNFKDVGFDEFMRVCREASAENDGFSLEYYVSVMSKLKSSSSRRNSLPIRTASPANSSARDSPNHGTPTTFTASLPGSGGKPKQITRIAGATENSQHSVDEEELEQFVLHINQIMQDEEGFKQIDPKSFELFQRCQDGIVLSKLINDSAAETIDERVLNRGTRLNPFQMTENNNLVINSAKAIGCSVVNIGSQDLIEGKEHLVLGLVWQIIKIGLLAKINLQFHPELFRLLGPGETLEDLLRLPADELLLRWFNYHLKQAGWHRQVNNFSSDLKDSENYIVLLNQLCPDECSRSALSETDLSRRADAVLQNAAKIGCRKYLSVKAILAGNPKLNLAFVANLFNHHPGLASLTEAELAELDEKLFSSLGDREARAFSLWMNSLGVEPFVNSIYDDLRDGRILLQVFDRVKKGSVVWRRVNQKTPLIRFKCIENTNYVIELGRQWNFSLVGIQGADLTDGSRTLTLALVWQLMKEHIIETLKTLSRDGRNITDQDIIDWANETVAASGKEHRICGFKDPSLRDSHFLLHLLNAMKKDTVNYELIAEGETEEGFKLNAKYAISVARKLGATIFVLPEDIIEVKPKMFLTFLGTLMAIHQRQSSLAAQN